MNNYDERKDVQKIEENEDVDLWVKHFQEDCQIAINKLNDISCLQDLLEQLQNNT